MSEKTHYQVEDIPPEDADTQVALYEQASEVVADSLKDAQMVFSQLEKILHEMFVEAENNSNHYVMEKINNVYDGVQRMAAISGQQGAALSGANTAISSLKQRDEVLEEFNDLMGALDVFDTEHPQLQAFVDTLRELDQEYYLEYSYDVTMDNFNEQVTEIISDLGDWHRADFMIANDLIRILEGDKAPSKEQKSALIVLLKTLDIERPQDGES